MSTAAVLALLALVAAAAGAVLLLLRQRDRLQAARDRAAAAAESEARFRAYVQAAPVGVVVVDTRGRCIDCNPAAAALLGLEPAAALAMNWFDVVPSEGQELAIQDFSTLLATGRIEAERQLQRAGGERFWAHVSAVRLDGERLLAYFEDVSERVNVARAAEEQAQRQRTIVETALDGFVLVGPDGRILEANRAWCRMLGYEREELLSMRIQEVDAVESAEDTRDHIRRIHTHGHDRFDSRQRRKDGSLIEVSVSVRLEEGGSGLMVAFVEDVTEQRRVERAAADRAARLEAYLASPAVGVVSVDARGRVEEANERICQLLGYERAEVLGRSWSSYTHPDDRESAARDMRAVLSGDVDGYTADRRYRHRDGSDVWLLISASAARRPDGSLDHVVAVAHDIGPLKRAEAALRQSEQHHRELVAALPIPVAFNDARRRILTVNARFTQVLGYRLEDIPDLETWFGKAYPDPSYREEVVRRWGEAYQRARETDGLVPPQEYRVTCRNGAVRTLSISGALLGDSLLVTLLDVTESHALQARLALSSRLAALGTLVAGVAHEVNNPLAAVAASTGTALEDVRDLRDRMRDGETLDRDRLLARAEELVEMLEDANASAARIASIVRDLTVLGKPDPVRLRTPLAAVARDALRWIPPEVAGRAEVRMEVDESVEALASAAQMSQVVANLIGNAALSFPDDRRGRIAVRVRRTPAGPVRVEVEDDGPGIPPEIQRRIFEPFFTTRAPGRGTGLGLAICHAIVTAHGGSIAVESQPGRGSTFRVELPDAGPRLELPAARPPV